MSKFIIKMSEQTDYWLTTTFSKIGEKMFGYGGTWSSLKDKVKKFDTREDAEKEVDKILEAYPSNNPVIEEVEE